MEPTTLEARLPKAFPQFSALPKELRLEIWRVALPDPQLLDLCIDATPDDKDCWTTKATFPEIVRVNHEAREVALESYEPMKNTWNKEHTPWQRCYINYDKDIAYFSYGNFTNFFDDDPFYNFPDLSIPIKPCKVKSMAVSSNTRFSVAAWPYLQTYDLDRVGEDSALEFYTDIFRRFYNLKEFLLVIDGTFHAFDGSDELVEPSSEDEDYYRPDGRITYTSWTTKFMEDLKVYKPEQNVPDIRVSLRINGRVPVKEHENLERRWKYNHAHCYVVPKDHEGDFSDEEYDGPRCAYMGGSDSESETDPAPV